MSVTMPYLDLQLSASTRALLLGFGGELGARGHARGTLTRCLLAELGARGVVDGVVQLRLRRDVGERRFLVRRAPHRDMRAQRGVPHRFLSEWTCQEARSSAARSAARCSRADAHWFSSTASSACCFARARSS